MRLPTRQPGIVMAFILGFLSWVPFLWLILDISPYNLGFLPSSSFGIPVPDFGWSIKPEFYPNNIPDGVISTTGISTLSLVIFYIPYIILVFVMIRQSSKKEVEP